MRRGCFLILILAWPAGSALGQLNSATVGRSGSFGNITNLNRNRLSSINLATGGRQQLSAPGAGRSANAISTSSTSGGVRFGGRRGSTSSIRGFGTTPLRPTSSGSLLMVFGRSPSARIFGSPIYDGRGGTFMPRTPQFMGTSARAILNPPLPLPVARSFHHQALLPRVGGAIRDELTNRSLRHAEPIPDDISFDHNAGRPTYSDLLARRIHAKFDKYVRDGWRLLGTEDLSPSDYVRSSVAFDNAATIDPGALEPRVGKLLCAVVGREFTTASAQLLAILTEGHNLLDLDLTTKTIFADPQTGQQIISELSRLVHREPDTPFLAALQAYMLWLDGQRTASLSAARKVREKFRTTPYAALADQLIARLDKPQHVDTASGG